MKEKMGIIKIKGIQNFFLMVLIFLVSCDTPSDCVDHYFSENYKSYIYANPGSYWVYEDTNLGIVDSIILVSQSVQFFDDCKPSGQPQEILTQELTSSYFKDYYNPEWKAIGHAQNNEYDAGFIQGWYADTGGNFIDSILVQGIWYKDIIECTTTNNKYYRSKGIGLVKKEFTDPNSSDTTYHFELIKYNIAK